LTSLDFPIFPVFLALRGFVVLGFGASTVSGTIDLISGSTSVFIPRLSCVTSCTPLIVSREPIYPIMPRYMIRMHVSISGAKAVPKTVTKSGDPAMFGLLLRNRYALAKVKASRATPMKRVTYPETSALSSISGTLAVN